MLFMFILSLSFLSLSISCFIISLFSAVSTTNFSFSIFSFSFFFFSYLFFMLMVSIFFSSIFWLSGIFLSISYIIFSFFSLFEVCRIGCSNLFPAPNLQVLFGFSLSSILFSLNSFSSLDFILSTRTFESLTISSFWIFLSILYLLYIDIFSSLIIFSSSGFTLFISFFLNKLLVICISVFLSSYNFCWGIISSLGGFSNSFSSFLDLSKIYLFLILFSSTISFSCFNTSLLSGFIICISSFLLSTFSIISFSWFLTPNLHVLFCSSLFSFLLSISSLFSLNFFIEIFSKDLLFKLSSFVSFFFIWSDSIVIISFLAIFWAFLLIKSFLNWLISKLSNLFFFSMFSFSLPIMFFSFS